MKRIRNIFLWIKCYWFNIHNIKKGYIWNSEFQRKDMCKHCGMPVYVFDKDGYEVFWYSVNAQRQTRKVLIEKTDNSLSVFVKQINEDIILRKVRKMQGLNESSEWEICW